MPYSVLSTLTVLRCADPGLTMRNLSGLERSTTVEPSRDTEEEEEEEETADDEGEEAEEAEEA